MGYNVSVRQLFPCMYKVPCARSKLFFNSPKQWAPQNAVGFALRLFHILKITFDTVNALLNYMLILGPRITWRYATSHP
jgi:hypothetical protein